VVVRRDELAAIKSFRNVTDVQLIEVGELNAYDVLCNDWIVFTSANLPSGTGFSGEIEAPTAPEASSEPEDVDAEAESE